MSKRQYNDSRNSKYISENLAEDLYFGNGYSVLKSGRRDLPVYMQEGYTNWMSEFNKKNDYLYETYEMFDKYGAPILAGDIDPDEWCNAYERYTGEVTPLQFYKDIFPPDTIEGRNEHDKPCPIISVTDYREDGTKYVHNLTVFNDYETLKRADKNDFALCSMCTYSGKHKTAKGAFKCHGFCIDLDGVDLKHLQILLMGFNKKIIPYPTYIVNSGHGVHVYYVFENPVPLYPKLINSLQRLKKGLTREVWTHETSSYNVKDRQFQGIYQNFRMVGSKSKLAYDKKKKRYRKTTKYIIRAFKIGTKVDITYLNNFVDKEYQMDADPNDWASYWSPDITPLNQAKELYPDWYERRIVQGLPKGHYKCSDGLYKWWLNKVPNIAKDGNRYWCIAFLYVYGIKCGIAKEWVDEDAYALIPLLDNMTVTEDNAFTEEDVESASRMYVQDSIDCPISFIEEKCGIHIERSRRNGRKQAEHLKRARAVRDVINDNWREGAGRPVGTTKTETKASKIIAQWKEQHPNGKKIECERDTGLSRHTILKWW